MCLKMFQEIAEAFQYVFRRLHKFYWVQRIPCNSENERQMSVFGGLDGLRCITGNPKLFQGGFGGILGNFRGFLACFSGVLGDFRRISGALHRVLRRLQGLQFLTIYLESRLKMFYRRFRRNS